ncbi:MAG: hypothetical protein GXP49_16665 [Deltaproteobacteria bacterium]|nr:hypothetical protein [Deltaproteobacteria bacterium]
MPRHFPTLTAVLVGLVMAFSLPCSTMAKTRKIKVITHLKKIKVYKGKKRGTYLVLPRGRALTIDTVGPCLIQVTLRRLLKSTTRSKPLKFRSLRDEKWRYQVELGGARDRKARVRKPWTGVSKPGWVQFDVPVGRHRYTFSVENADSGTAIKIRTTHKRKSRFLAKEIESPKEPARSGSGQNSSIEIPPLVSPTSKQPSLGIATTKKPEDNNPPKEASRSTVVPAGTLSPGNKKNGDEVIMAYDETNQQKGNKAGKAAASGLPEKGALEKARTRPWLGVGLVVSLMVSSGKPSDTSLAGGKTTPSGNTGLAFPVLLDIKGYIPAWKPYLDIVPGLEIGWFRLQGSGKSDLPNDPDFSSYNYSWHIDNLPVFVGIAGSVTPVIAVPLHISLGTGFAANYCWAQTTYKRKGLFAVTNAVQKDWALGWYIGLELAYTLGPGRLKLEYRYSSARTDLKFKDIYNNAYNSDLGDLEGSNIMLGYRLDLPFW